MANSRDVTKAIIKEQYFLLGQSIEAAAKAKAAWRKAMADLEEQAKNYTAEYRAELATKARSDLVNKYQALYDKVKADLEKLQTALVEYHGFLDLSDPALTNALKLIELNGRELGTENILKINAQFAGDQSAMRLLQTTYKARGVAYDGSLDRQIYEAEDAVKAMGLEAYAALVQQGSLNRFASTVGKYAKLEGLAFETVPDPEGVTEATRRGAGLAVPTLE